MKDFESALKEYDTATKLDPNDPVIRTNRADVLVELQRKDDAFQEYNQALASKNK
jgi:Flp pilus assembly protein TadD